MLNVCFSDTPHSNPTSNTKPVPVQALLPSKDEEAGGVLVPERLLVQALVVPERTSTRATYYLSECEEAIGALVEGAL